jgi:hypothetical protein
MAKCLLVTICSAVLVLSCGHPPERKQLIIGELPTVTSQGFFELKQTTKLNSHFGAGTKTRYVHFFQNKKWPNEWVVVVESWGNIAAAKAH